MPPNHPSFLLPRYASEANWFLEPSGTCDLFPPLTTPLNTPTYFTLFLFLTILLAILSASCNFISLLRPTRQLRTFRNAIFQGIVIDILASLPALPIGFSSFRPDNGGDSWLGLSNLHYVVWTVLFGFRPGSIMAILQFFKGDELAGAAAVSQMVPNAIFHFAGAVLVLNAENGKTLPVAYGEYRGAVFVGVGFFLLQALLLVGICAMYARSWGEKVACERYKVFISLGGRSFVLFLGVVGIIGSLVMMVVAGKMCGNLTTFFGAVCQACQLFLSAFWGFYRYRMAKQNQ
ncbi:hypothetical protein B0J14DRAFT_678484 [Halenospora varia]|nr:hypothetical protein B0J14DRAFT_678484 [Halenospora varia]